MSRKKASPSDFQYMPKTATVEEPTNNIRVIREYVEALVIALALAFFFKAFAAEAFVIPTGSMATTLMGRHKDVACEQCGFAFQISASEESNDGSERPMARNMPEVVAGTCPQCRHTMYVGRDNVDKKTFLSFNGDRIFVNKSQFDFRDPSRWHVTVFRYPGKPQINYIKRLIGVENETVLLRNGDVFVKKDGQGEFEIQRKPLRALLSMLRPVDDNDYVQPKLHELGLPTRWNDEAPEGTVWKRSEDYKSFESIAGEDGWLSYRNIVPSSDDWYYLSQNQLPPQGKLISPELVTDFLGYNSEIIRFADRFAGNDLLVGIREVNENGNIRKEHFCRKNIQGLGLNWVGDLTVGCRLTARTSGGSVAFRLIKGGVAFLCTIDLSNGNAELSIPEVPEFEAAVVQTPVHGAGSWNVLFCNVDEELRLVVDGREINFGLQGRYDRLCQPGSRLARDRSPTRLDLAPAAIGISKAEVKVEHLKVCRDMYYIACNEFSGYHQRQCDLLDSPFMNEYSISENAVHRVLSSPESWSRFGKTQQVEFQLGPREYLMLGDNSAKSKDSRLWTTDGIPHQVDRELLIGEAVFVYWPHGLRVPGTKIALIPNLWKVRFID